MKNKYLSKHEINKLKEDLMSDSKSNKKPKSPKSISSAFYQMKNIEIGQVFEKNICNILEFDYNWKNIPNYKSFLYSEITYEEKTEIVTSINEKEIFINNNKIIFKINNNKSLNIVTNGITETIKAQKEIIITKYDKQILIKPITDIEIDGFFGDIDLTKFNEKEITVLGTNIGKGITKNYYNQKAIIEIKLGKEKVEELFEQFKKDKYIFETLLNESFLFIGFINSKSIDFKELKEITSTLNDLKYILFGVKNSIFAGKDITKFYDWDVIKKMKDINNRMNTLEKKVGDVEGALNTMKEDFRTMKEDFRTMKEDFQKIINLFAEKIENDFKKKKIETGDKSLLMKKRQRRKKGEKKEEKK